MKKNLTVALAGNPNSGKTALFNALTGSRQKEGNWPGVTVSKKTGYFASADSNVSVVDLPGVYSLSVVTQTGSLDERVSLDYLHSGEVDVIVNVVDASHLERNLYLTLQLLEMGLPMILVVNMSDIAKQHGIEIDFNQLQQRLGIPVVTTVATKRQGIDTLKTQICQTPAKSNQSLSLLSAPLKRLHQQLTDLIGSNSKELCPDWLALKCLEQDYYAWQLLDATLKEQVQAAIQQADADFSEDVDILIADGRYQAIHQLVQEAVIHKKTLKQSFSEKLDNIILNRFLGIPIFLLVMYLMFLFAINIGGAFQDFFDIGSTVIFVDGLAHVLLNWHWPVWLVVILANGLGKGINTVVTFAPVIAGMFLFLSFLEDSGYMARAAFVMDRFMQWLGLPGKSFVPMIIGFGCNVPAVMAARTLDNPRDRVLTVMMMPFMACGARLAIFAVFASAFFPQGGASIIFLLYVVGIVVAMLTGLVLRKTLLQGEASPMIMEMPNYHLPTLKGIVKHTWHRLRGFLLRAGKVIVPVCLVVGVLNSITVDGHLVASEQSQQHSLLAKAGKVVTPIFHPIGIEQKNWPATVGLATGVLAKEVVVGTLNTLYSSSAHLTEAHQDFAFWPGLKQALLSVPENLSHLGQAFANPIAASEAGADMDQRVFGVMVSFFAGKAAAFAYLLFVLLYFPCISTLAAMKREVGNFWSYFSMGWSFLVAYSAALISFQAMTFLLHPSHSATWIIIDLLVLAMTVWFLRRFVSKHHVVGH